MTSDEPTPREQAVGRRASTQGSMSSRVSSRVGEWYRNRNIDFVLNSKFLVSLSHTAQYYVAHRPALLVHTSLLPEEPDLVTTRPNKKQNTPARARTDTRIRDILSQRRRRPQMRDDRDVFIIPISKFRFHPLLEIPRPRIASPSEWEHRCMLDIRYGCQLHQAVAFTAQYAIVPLATALASR